jgi:hypothetical protein
MHCSLAQLYAPNNMPENLRKAHTALDKAVDPAYGYKPAQGNAESYTATDEGHVAFLFTLYQTLT